MIANFSKNQLTLIIGAIFIVLASAIFPIYLFGRTVGNSIYPNTYIDGIDMGRKSKAEASELLQRRDDYLKETIVTILYNDAPLATYSAETLAIRRDTQTKVDQAYIVGRTPVLTSRLYQQVNALFKLNKIEFTTTMTYDADPIEQFIVDTADSFDLPAKNALFTFENGKVTSFRAHENGRQINQEEFLADVKNGIESISAKNTNLAITIQDEVIKPEITLSNTNDFGIEELIAEGKSDYSGSISSRIHNIVLATSKFNGVMIPKGTEFSFNEIIGEISQRTGYQSAYIISGGRTVLGDGGGVCQVSTTVFRAALNAGLEITERNAHAYRVSYYENDSEPGFDATIYTPSVDFRFKNDTPSDILIQTEIDEDNQLLTFKFYGKKDNRTVEISPVTVWDVVPPPEPLYEDDATLANGVVKQVDYAAWGAKAKFNYKVTKGTEVQEETFYSNFRPWRAVYLRGTKEG